LLFYNNFGNSEVLEDGARPEASFVLPSIHIVEKISFCIIRISLKFVNSSVSLPWIRQSPQATDGMIYVTLHLCLKSSLARQVSVFPLAFGDTHP